MRPQDNPHRLTRGFHVLISAQFCSALADNALLIVCIALLLERGLPAWWAPMLKFCFTIAYVVLAPFVGALADAMPKGRLMMIMNGVKVAGVLTLLCGLNPLLALAVVGVGAAAYAPAKYGLVTELVPPAGLVAANGWIEVTTVCAAVFGTAIGGLLISPWMAASLTAAAQAIGGDWAYELTLRFNRHFNSLRARLGLPYWSLSKYLKLKVKRAVSYVGDFETAVAREARSRGVQGVVCGHIHHAEMRSIDGVLYCNDGDWVESLTALVEHADGRLEIIDWAQRRALLKAPLEAAPLEPALS